MGVLSNSSITLPLPSLPLALAILLPVTGWALHSLTSVPPIAKSKLKISPGLYAIPGGPAKDRVEEIYPEGVFGHAAYADLPLGRVKYALSGPEDGRKVVLIHGFSIPSVIFKDIVDRLVGAGFRVLTYDLYGRGYSDSPNVSDPPSLYATQLALLLQHVSWSKARVVGLSMGGAVAAAFAAQFPDLVDGHIVFLASAGTMPDNYFSRTIGFLTSPLAQSIVSTNLLRLVTLQSKVLPHYTRVLSSSTRYGPVRGVEESFKAIGRSDLHALIIHGTADEIVPYTPFAVPNLTTLLPRAKLVTLENVTHSLASTHPDEVVQAIVEFFDN